MGGAEPDIVGGIGGQNALLVFEAVAFGDELRRVGHDLHQALGPGGAARGRVELAFLARQAEDEGLLDRLAHPLPVGQGPDRIIPVVDVDAALGRGLGQPERHGGAAGVGDEIGDGVHLVGGIEAARQRPQEHAEIVLASRPAHDLKGAHHFVMGDALLGGRRRKPADDIFGHLAEADLLARQLSIIDGGMGGRLAVGGLCLLGPAHPHQAPALPVAAPGLLGAVAGEAGKFLEMAKRQAGVAERAKRDPAGQEFALDRRVARGETVGAGDLVGGLVGLLAAGSDRMAGGDAALDPPGRGVAVFGRIGGDCEEHFARSVPFLVFAMEAGERIAHRHLLAHLGRQLGIVLVGLGDAANEFLRHLGGILIAGAEAAGGADRGVGLLGEDEPPQAPASLGIADHRLELRLRLLGEGGIGGGIGPHIGNEAGSTLWVARGELGAGKREASLRRQRLALGEMGKRRGRRLLVGIERLLGPLEERFLQGPARRRGQKVHDPAMARFLRPVAQIDEFDELDRRPVARSRRRRAGIDEIAGECQLRRLDREARGFGHRSGKRRRAEERGPLETGRREKQGAGEFASIHRCSYSSVDRLPQFPAMSRQLHGACLALAGRGWRV